MKAKLAGLVAAPLLVFSSYGLAQEVMSSQEAASEPMMLSMSEMDGITAGYLHVGDNFIIGSPQTVVNLTTITQVATATGAITGAGSAVIAANAAGVTNYNRLVQVQR